MSMTFWMRRKRRAAMLREQERQNEALKNQETEVTQTEEVTKPTRKRVSKNDGGADIES